MLIYIDFSLSILQNPNDSALVEQSSMDEPWQQFIIGGPTTVSLLGQVMVVSSVLDFSFTDISPDQKYVYMQYPQSFRATLMQIANGKAHLRIAVIIVFFLFENARSYEKIDHCYFTSSMTEKSDVVNLSQVCNF